ncbi:uncharacterized protein TNCV_2430481 [Trichonephila clavipes]|nr:uncharacterized protein TNCV_2430481 [Trichonephila clavipes]
MIKSIDFCEVWFLPESVARVAVIVGDTSATRLGIDSKRLWMCSRKSQRVSQPGKQFNLVIDEESLENVCDVWSRIILLKYGCGQALKVRKDTTGSKTSEM